MNNINMPTLKQFEDLSQEDFIENPVWIECHTADYDEIWYDETDEETFRPILNSESIDLSENSYLVKATFVLNDGTKLNGFFTPQETADNEDEFSYVQPQIFVGNKFMSFWFGISKPSEDMINDFYEKLEKDTDAVFPIHYTSDYEFKIRKIKGRINGFGYIDDIGMKMTK